MDGEPYDIRKAHYAAALAIWRKGPAYDFNKPSGHGQYLTPDEAAEVEAKGYPTDGLPARCADPRETPLRDARESAEAGRGCHGCGATGDSHLSFSFFCGRCCHSTRGHLPTEESMARFKEEVMQAMDFAILGGTDEAFLAACGIAE